MSSLKCSVAKLASQISIQFSATRVEFERRILQSTLNGSHVDNKLWY